MKASLGLLRERERLSERERETVRERERETDRQKEKGNGS